MAPVLRLPGSPSLTVGRTRPETRLWRDEMTHQATALLSERPPESLIDRIRSAQRRRQAAKRLTSPDLSLV